MIYIYVFEDGTVKQSPLPPFNGDLECVGNGILSVYRCNGTKLEEVDQNDNWSEVTTANYNMICGQEFHD
jgi:hypothetical protein